MMSQKVIVEYRTLKEFCSCCNQKLSEPKTSDIRQFFLSKENLLENRRDWEEVAEFEDDLDDVVREYVYDTVDFFATNSYDMLLIDDCEFEKVKRFILEEVIS